MQFAQRDEWTLLCDALASKLLAAGNTLAATLCYICAGNIDKTVEIWSQCLSAEPEKKPYVDRLQVSLLLAIVATCEKIVFACEYVNFSDNYIPSFSPSINLSIFIF